MSGVFYVNKAMPKCRKAVSAPNRSGFEAHSEPFAIAAISNRYVYGSTRGNAALENGVRALVRVHVTGEHEVDFGVVKNAFHGSAHADFFSLVVVCFVAVVPRRMHDGDEPGCEGAVNLLQVTDQPLILRRAWDVRAIAAQHDYVSSAHVEGVIQVADVGFGAAGD